MNDWFSFIPHTVDFLFCSLIWRGVYCRFYSFEVSPQLTFLRGHLGQWTQPWMHLSVLLPFLLQALEDPRWVPVLALVSTWHVWHLPHRISRLLQLKCRFKRSDHVRLWHAYMWVSQEKHLQFQPKNSIMMTSICPEFRHPFWMATLLHVSV